MTRDWSDAELKAAVAAYLEMRSEEARGVPYSKTDFRRALIAGALKRRTHGSIEYRMQNISSVLAKHGKSPLKGYLPAKHVGDRIGGRIADLLKDAGAI